MRSPCEEEGRRKVLFKSMRSTVSDGVKRISRSRRRRGLFQQNRPQAADPACPLDVRSLGVKRTRYAQPEFKLPAALLFCVRLMLRHLGILFASTLTHSDSGPIFSQDPYKE